jgi:hypothetical protein
MNIFTLKYWKEVFGFMYKQGFFLHSQDELWNLIPPRCKSVYLCLGWSYPELEKTFAK